MNPTPQPTSSRTRPSIWMALSFAGQLAWVVENWYFNTSILEL